MSVPRILGRVLSGAVVAASVLAAPLAANATASSAHADAGSGMFAAGTRWTGEFADASITKVGNTYYAYATATGGDNVPVLHSTNLTTWYARAAYSPDSNPGWWKGYNDALPHPATWALYDVQRNGHSFTRPWAPSVAAVGSHYVLAYSVPVSEGNPNRRCISIATGSSPQGEFVDSSSGPIVCTSDPNGSNDPELFTDGGSTYLMWKNAGVPGKSPTMIWSRRLNSNGTAFAPGTHAHMLMATAQRWENNVIEGPSMINYGHRYYLFWAGNGYLTANYAIGYAICSSPLGGCKRQQHGPLLSSAGGMAGPGSPSPVVGPHGGLRLGYSAWDRGQVGYAAGGHRRLHVATLGIARNGRLSVQSVG